MDETETKRKILSGVINLQVGSQDKDKERARLEAQHGKVYDTSELSAEFEVLGFAAPFVVVRERATGKKGTLMFQHSPRFYFGFVEDRG